MNRKKPAWRLLLLAPTMLVTGQIVSAAPPLSRSISPSGQFIIYGTDPQVRGTLSDAAEREKAALLTLLREKDNWKTPIVLNIQNLQANVPESPPALLHFSQTGFGLKLQLDLMISADLNPSTIGRELLRVFLLEMMYRSQPNLATGTPYKEPPPWLLDGIHALACQEDIGGFGDLLKGLGSRSKGISLDEFLKQRPELLDSPSRELYHAFCWVFLTLLTSSTDGCRSLVRFIGDLPAVSGNAIADLLSHFPILGGSLESAEKVWRTKILQVVSQEKLQSLTVKETERQLDQLLHLQFPTRSRAIQSWNLEEYPGYMRLPNRVTVLKRLSEDLMRLGAHAHPVYRSILLEYQRAAISLARGQKFGISQRLLRSRQSREQLLAKMAAIDDYMNWFEATQSTADSGEFIEYLKATKRSSDTGRRRHDRISIYLDAMEIQFSE